MKDNFRLRQAYWVLGVAHGVEGTDGSGELVKDVEVSVVLLTNKLSEGLLGGSAAGCETREMERGGGGIWKYMKKKEKKRAQNNTRM